MDSIIKIKNLTVILEKRVKALNNLSLELPAGHIVGLIGPSGAGKTTLIRTIIGSQKITDGDIEVLGKPTGNKGLRRQIGYMPQSESTYDDLTVRENLSYFCRIVGAESGSVNRVLDEVRMQKHADRIVSSLSGGQKSRVSLAIALLGKPKLLVLDEPTVGLDPVLRQELWELFRRLVERGTTLIVSSHVMDEAQHCDTLLLVRGGKKLALGPPAQLCKEAKVTSVEELFLSLVKREKV